MNDLYIMEMNDELYQRFKQSEHVINAKVKSVLRQISSLKYATHELYVPAPYQDELAGLPYGRIRKDVEERDCLNQPVCILLVSVRKEEYSVLKKLQRI